MLLPALTGKVEMVYEGEQKGLEVVARQLIGDAVKTVFLERFPSVGREVGGGGEDDVGPYSAIVSWFAGGGSVSISDSQSFEDYEAALGAVPGLLDLAAGYGDDSPEARAFGAELILEGLHQHLKLSREDLDSSISYKELVKFQLLRRRRLDSPDDDLN
jgi:magnesium chelatase subunit I